MDFHHVGDMDVVLRARIAVRAATCASTYIAACAATRAATNAALAAHQTACQASYAKLQGVLLQEQQLTWSLQARICADLQIRGDDHVALLSEMAQRARMDVRMLIARHAASDAATTPHSRQRVYDYAWLSQAACRAASFLRTHGITTVQDTHIRRHASVTAAADFFFPIGVDMRSIHRPSLSRQQFVAAHAASPSSSSSPSTPPTPSSSTVASSTCGCEAMVAACEQSRVDALHGCAQCNGPVEWITQAPKVLARGYLPWCRGCGRKFHAECITTSTSVATKVTPAEILHQFSLPASSLSALALLPDQMACCSFCFACNSSSSSSRSSSRSGSLA
jgi:hypothetical protein